MNVKTLIDRLSRLPENMEVYLAPRTTEFEYGELNTVYVKEIKFSEENENEETTAYVHCVILDEEGIGKDSTFNIKSP